MTDPWVSYDGGGNAYFIGQPIDSAALGLSAVSITSFDREAGAWRPPQILIEDVGDRGAFNDKISVTGDPTRPGYAYATWLRGDYPNGGAQSENADLHSFAYRGLPMFSRTTDGGLTWSTPVAMRRSTRTSKAIRSLCSRTGRCSTWLPCCSAVLVSSRTRTASS